MAIGGLFTGPWWQVVNGSGAPYNGAVLKFYTAGGTSTPSPVYSDATLGTPLGTTVTADGAGRFVPIWLANHAYYVELYASATGSLIATADNVQDDLVALISGQTPFTLLTFDGQTVEPSASAAGDAAVYYNSTADALLVSRNTGAYQAVSYVNPATAGGRLTLVGGQPVPYADVTGASTLYYTPYLGETVALWDGTRWREIVLTEVSLALTLTDATNYDVWLYLSSGVPTLEVEAWRVSGIALTNATNATPVVVTPASSTALVAQDAVYVNGVQGNLGANGLWAVTLVTNPTTFSMSAAGTGAYTASTGWLNARIGADVPSLTDGAYIKGHDRTRRYLGSIRASGTNTCEDSAAKRLVWNVQNRVTRALQRFDATNSWTYSTATWRQANADTANQVALICGLVDNAVQLELATQVSNSSGGAVLVRVGLGEDNTAAIAATALVQTVTTDGLNTIRAAGARMTVTPVPGYHALTWLEYSAAAATTTWYGDNNTPTLVRSGLVGLWSC